MIKSTVIPDVADLAREPIIFINYTEYRLKKMKHDRSLRTKQ